MIYFVLFILFIFSIFRNWFTSPIISAFDMPFFYPDRLKEISSGIYAWSSLANYGLGWSTLFSLNIDLYLVLGIKLLVEYLHLTWNSALKLWFFYPFLIFSLISSFYFSGKFFKEFPLRLISVLLYTTNTYILMLVGGGQMGVALAYSLAPLVLGSFLRENLPLFSGSLSLMFLFDYRLSAIVLLVTSIWLFFDFGRRRILNLIVGSIIALVINSFWIFPILSSPQTVNASIVRDTSLSFYSVARFSDALSLLHPNWPENIFGKVYFFRPQFLLIPIFAFLTLIFGKKSEKKPVIILVLFVLLGAFLAKGVNDPFGEIYVFFLNLHPVFSAFRDPTKFYLLLVLSYTILLPWGFNKILPKKVSFIFFILLQIFLLVPFYQGQVRGSFAKVNIAEDYHRLEKLLSEDKEFSRSLVVPFSNRFVYATENHPVVPANLFFGQTDFDKIENAISQQNIKNKLQNYSIKYLVVPEDSLGEIFLTDRKYDDRLRKQFITTIDKTNFFQKLEGFKNLTVYKIEGAKNHFYAEDDSVRPVVQKVSPVSYAVTLLNVVKPFNLIFTESYNPGWILLKDNKTVKSKKTSTGFNSFYLDKVGSYRVNVSFGRAISQEFWKTDVGGKELNLTLKKSTKFSLVTSGWGSGLEVFSQDKKTMLVNNDGSDNVYQLQLDKNKNYTLRIRTFCSGPPECLLLIKDLSVDGILQKQETNKKTLAVIGDSISNTNGPEGYTYQLADKLGYKLINSSIFGSTLGGAILRYKQDIIDNKPDVLLILIGTNDIGQGADSKKFINNYRQMLISLQKEIPLTKIYVEALFSRYDGHQEEIIKYNEELQQLAKELGVSFLDINKNLSRADYSDELHPSHAAQEKIADLFFARLQNE